MLINDNLSVLKANKYPKSTGPGWFGF